MPESSSRYVIERYHARTEKWVVVCIVSATTLVEAAGKVAGFFKKGERAKISLLSVTWIAESDPQTPNGFRSVE